MADKTIIKIKEDPIIIRMTGKGVPGRTGPAGAKGDDGIVWTLSLSMTDTPDGQCTMRLYKDGVLCTQESHYAYVQVLAYYHGSTWIESSYSEIITGTATFTYTNAKALFVTIYEDSFREKILCANTVNCGRNDWTVVPVMAASPDGTCTITLYKDGAVYNKACYAEVRTLAYNASNYVLSSSYSGNFTGTKTFTYTNTRGVFVSVYTNSGKTDFLCSECVNYGQSATIAVGTVKQGATAAVTNVGTPLNATFDFTLPKGDQGEVSVAETETLPAGSAAYVQDLLPNDPNRALLKFGIPNGGGSGARVEGRTLILDAGAIFTPSVSSAGVLSWSNNASLPNPASVNVKGPAGAAAVISSVSANGLPAGSDPTVQNTGTTSNAKFVFGIPKGDTGAKGDKGVKGDTATVRVGTVTTGAAGTNASVVNAGTDNDAVLNFTIPRGADGDGYCGAQYDGTQEGVIFEVSENMLSDMAFEDDAPSNNKEYIRKNGAWAEPKAISWGSITGTLSNQTDLQNALNGKSDVNHTHASLENIAAVYDSASESLTLTI